MQASLRAVRPALLLAALAAGTWLRLRGLGELALFGDEHHTLLLADAPWREILGTFDAFGSHVPLALLERLALDVLGAGLVPFRLVALAPGLATLFLAYPLLRRFVGQDAAALATAWLALSPMHVYYSRFARGYALAGLLALLFLALLERWLAGKRGRRRGAALAAAAALLPWVHLSSLGFLAGSAALALARAARAGRAAFRGLLAWLALAGLASALLFAPVAPDVVRYFRAMEPEEGSLLSLGLPTLLAGSRAAGLVGLVLFARGLWTSRREGSGAALASAGLAGAVLTLVLTVPRGMDYAWARYLLLALPFALAIAAHAFLEPFRGAGAPWGAAWLVAGAALGYRGGWSVPPAAAEPGSAFANTYLALHPLSAFDEPYPRASAIYATLAAEPAQSVLEVPPIATRAVLLYRSHARAHGKRVRLGWIGPLPRALQAGPYVALDEVGAGVGAGEAGWLVLHRDPRREVSRYFRFVAEEAWPRRRSAADEPFMARHAALYRANLPDAEAMARLAEPLRARLGPPAFEDEEVLAWRLGP
jgi:hypothetical protein